MSQWGIFFRHCWRYAVRNKVLTLLNILGIALGVSVFSGIRMIHDSALASFRASVDLVAGKAHVQVIGDGVGMDETFFSRIRSLPMITGATPVVESVVMLENFPGEYLHVVGVDLFTNRPFRTFDIAEGDSKVDAAAFVREPNAVALTESLMHRLGFRSGERIVLRHRGERIELCVRGIIKTDESSAGMDEHTAVMDIANAQELLGTVGRIDRVDLRVEKESQISEVIKAVEPLIPSNARVQSAERRGDQIEKMIGAFQLNLTALALISLLVGMFIIYNTVSAAVVRRRFEIGVLRALGFTPGQVQRLFLFEALTIGVVGIALGLWGGVGLARGLISTVAQNITTLYLLVAIQKVTPDIWTLVGGAGAAFAAIIVAAIVPSFRAGKLSPIEAMQAVIPEGRGKKPARGWGWIAGGCLAVAFLLGWKAVNGGPAWLGFGTALLVLMGGAALIPVVSWFILKLFPTTGVEGSLALRNFRESLHRNSVTMAALAVALAMVVALSVMIQSFRTTVSVWMDRSVRADLFISSAANLVVGHKETLPDAMEKMVESLPGVAAIDSYREIKIRYQDRPVKLASIRFDIAAKRNPLDFVRGDGTKILKLAAERGEVVVSESFSRKFNIREGDEMELAAPSGRKKFKVAGVIYDYTTEFGLILIDRVTYAREWMDSNINSLALYAKEGETAEVLRDRLRPQVASMGNYLLYSNHDLRNQVFRIFDQTFAVTYLLQTIGLIVSAVSIWLGQQILLAERRNDLGVLRASGASCGQVMGVLLRETAGVALLGSLFGLAGGLALAWVLSEVINIAFFGWTLRWNVPWVDLGLLIPAVVGVALVSAWGPTKRILRKPIAALVFRL